jgi:hypothetical protein
LVNAQDAATYASIKIPESGYQIVSERAEAQDSANSMGQALLAEIEAWLSSEFDLPTIREHPHLKFVLADKMAELRFRNLLPDPGAGIATNDPTASAQGDTVAIYQDATRTIYLPEGWTGNTAAEVSILVHEMVHHFQKVLGLKHECPQEREKLAYLAQDHWLRRSGHSLADDFMLDPFSVLVKTACFY